MPAAIKTIPKEELLEQLAQIETDLGRRKFLSTHKGLISSEVVKQLADLVLEKIRVDTKEALHLAEAAVLVGRKLRRKEDIALGTRAKAQDLVAAVQGYVLLQSGVFVTSIIPAHQPPAVYANRLSVSLTIPQTLLASLESQPNIGIAYLIDPAKKLPMRLLKFESGLDGALLKQYAAACPH